MQNLELKKINRPMAVWVFGIGNLVIGIYFLIPAVIRWINVLLFLINKPEEHNLVSISGLLFPIFSTGMAIWLIVLGFGLLAMKRWAKRGSILYGWIWVLLIAVSLLASLGPMIRGAQVRMFIGSVNIDNVLAVIRSIYMILLLIFMKTAKVKQAFAGIENG